MGWNPFRRNRDVDLRQRRGNGCAIPKQEIEPEIDPAQDDDKDALLDEALGEILELRDELMRVKTAPHQFGTVVEAPQAPNPNVFLQGDRVAVLDPDLIAAGKINGRLDSTPDEYGFVVVKFRLFGGRHRLNIGLNGNPKQVQLLGKSDGTEVLCSIDGKLFGLNPVPGLKLEPCELVRCDLKQMQILGKTGRLTSGEVCAVRKVLNDKQAEIQSHEGERIVLCANGLELKPGDRVLLDHGGQIIVQKLDNDQDARYTISSPIDSSLTWNDLAGCEEVKAAFQEVIFAPRQNPGVYERHGRKQPKGILLAGPPGCGKTYSVKVMVAELCHLFGNDKLARGGFFAVDAPELLSHLVSIAEHKIAGLFYDAEKFYEETGLPGIIYIDEAEALLGQRGKGISTDINKTIVPMFLTKMNGLRENHAIVILGSNQPKTIDPGVTREGRVDQTIRVGRPTKQNAIQYFRIHTRKTCWEQGVDPEQTLHDVIQEIFSPDRRLYAIGTHRGDNEAIFTFGHAISGARIAEICNAATDQAIKREIRSGQESGVTKADFLYGVEKAQRYHQQTNNEFDLDDYLDLNGFDRNSVVVRKVS